MTTASTAYFGGPLKPYIKLVGAEGWDWHPIKGRRGNS